MNLISELSIAHKEGIMNAIKKLDSLKEEVADAKDLIETYELLIDNCNYFLEEANKSIEASKSILQIEGIYDLKVSDVLNGSKLYKRVSEFSLDNSMFRTRHIERCLIECLALELDIIEVWIIKFKTEAKRDKLVNTKRDMKTDGVLAIIEEFERLKTEKLELMCKALTK